jgi:hypothetical protein
LVRKRLAAIASVALLGAVLSGCSSQPSPEDVAKQFVSDLQNGKWDDAQSLVANPNKDVQKPDETALAIFKKDKFEVGQATINGNNASVSVHVTSPDMTQIVRGMLGDAIANALTGGTNDNATFTKDLENRLNSSSVPMTSSDVHLNLVKTDQGWKISSDNMEFMSAAVGHLDQFANLGSNNSTSSSASSSSGNRTSASDPWTYFNNAKWSGNWNGLQMQIEKIVVTDKGPDEDGSGKTSYVGMKFKMTNTTKNTMTAYPDQARLVTSTGEQIDNPDMLASDHIGGEIEGGVTKEGQVVWRLNNGHASDIKWVRIEWDVHTGPETDFSAPTQKMSVTLNLK